MKYQKLYQAISSTIQARDNCIKTKNKEWEDKHNAELRIMEKYLPSGSGVDSDTRIDSNSKPNKLILTFSFHHMDENGMYSRWTDHTAVVTPSLANDIDIRITGPDYNQIKDYLHTEFDYHLNEIHYDVDRRYDFLMEKRNDTKYAVSLESRTNGNMYWKCSDKEFNSWIEAKKWAIEEMEK